MHQRQVQAAKARGMLAGGGGAGGMDWMASTGATKAGLLMHALGEFDAMRQESLVPPDMFTTDVDESDGGGGSGGLGARPRQRVRVFCHGRSLGGAHS